jgi:5'-nucleotidase
MMSKLTMLLAALTLAAVVAGGALAAGTAADRPAATAHKCAKGKKHKVARGKHFCVRIAKPKPKPKPPVNVQLLAINDFHGNLEPPTGSSGRVTTGYNGTTPITVDAGGAEYLATHVKALRTQNPRNTVFVAGGDLIGASPLLSGLFHDEPTIEALNGMGLQFSAVGNHEFDEGVPELLRIQFGGCHPADGCQDEGPFVGALFHYLAAGVYVDEQLNRSVFPPYEVRTVGGVKIGFIGIPTDTTPTIVTPAGVAGLRFVDEADTINRYAAILKRQGVQTIVVLIHEGGVQNSPTQTYNSCEQLSGDIVPIVEKLDAEIDVVFSAHTHQAYNCRIRNMLVTSAASFGRLITQAKLTISAKTGDVTAKSATNVIVTRDVAKDTAETTLVAHYNQIAGPIANRVVGAVTADITRAANNAGESALGDVIADAQLEATAPTDFGGAVIAFMNPGGIRAELTYNNNTGGETPGQVTYNELFTVQPFNNVMTVATCTGAQIKQILEQQFDNPSAGQDRVLQVSRGFTYSYNRSAAAGSRVDASTIRLAGAPIVPTQSYRVAMNNFLFGGGDNFTTFRSCTSPLGGEIDLDVLVRYFQQKSPIAPGARDRITRTG